MRVRRPRNGAESDAKTSSQRARLKPRDEGGESLADSTAASRPPSVPQPPFPLGSRVAANQILRRGRRIALRPFRRVARVLVAQTPLGSIPSAFAPFLALPFRHAHSEFCRAHEAHCACVLPGVAQVTKVAGGVGPVAEAGGGAGVVREAAMRAVLTWRDKAEQW